MTVWVDKWGKLGGQFWKLLDHAFDVWLLEKPWQRGVSAEETNSRSVKWQSGHCQWHRGTGVGPFCALVIVLVFLSETFKSASPPAPQQCGYYQNVRRLYNTIRRSGDTLQENSYR